MHKTLKVKNEAENDLYKGKYHPDIDRGSDCMSTIQTCAAQLGQKNCKTERELLNIDINETPRISTT